MNLCIPTQVRRISALAEMGFVWVLMQCFVNALILNELPVFTAAIYLLIGCITGACLWLLRSGTLNLSVIDAF
jgi:hypothetical protein